MSGRVERTDRTSRTSIATRLRGGAFERITWRVTFGVVAVLTCAWIGRFYLWPSTANLFLDAHIYYRATDAWLAGGNPWLTTYRDIPFAGIPPTLLLNVPLMPFGETLATVFWVAANTGAVAFLILRLRLPLWIVVMLPVVEGWLGASPDLALAALVVGRGGWIAALTKPYSAPASLGKRRWRTLAIAGAVGAVTIPMLPWLLFWDSREVIAQSFAEVAGTTQSAAGRPELILLVVVALVSLGWRRGWSLTTPSLLAQQPHYMMFSLETIASSRILTLAAMIPADYGMAVAVITYAIANRIRALWRHPR